MKKTVKLLILFLLSILVLSTLAACSKSETTSSEKPENVTVPTQVQAVKDKVLNLAAEYALELNGDFGDKHAALIASGQGRDYPEYPAMLEKLKAIQEECGAYYVYTLIDSDPKDKGFDLIVDASPEPDDFMLQYEVEGQFVDALKGTPAAALSAWDNDTDDPCWSAFAPIYDTKGNIVAILGIDYPAPEILDYPEWNRDSDKWNELHY